MRDWRNLALDCALQAGALTRCAGHPDILLSVDQPNVQTDAWLALEQAARAQGFDGDADRYLQPDYIYVLQSADEFCPHCGSEELQVLTTSSLLLTYILTGVASRPAMYIGSKVLHDLFIHLSGWRAHRHIMPDEDKFADRFFSDFHSYVQEHYRESRSKGWAQIISERTTEPDSELDVFFALLRDFALSETTP